MCVLCAFTCAFLIHLFTATRKPLVCRIQHSSTQPWCHRHWCSFPGARRRDSEKVQIEKSKWHPTILSTRQCMSKRSDAVDTQAEVHMLHASYLIRLDINSNDRRSYESRADGNTDVFNLKWRWESHRNCLLILCCHPPNFILLVCVIYARKNHILYKLSVAFASMHTWSTRARAKSAGRRYTR